MTFEQEQSLKKMAAMQANVSGMLGTSRDLEEPARPSLRERVDSQARSARGESRKAERLEELRYLLEKHPEVARILDLIEDVRG